MIWKSFMEKYVLILLVFALLQTVPACGTDNPEFTDSEERVVPDDEKDDIQDSTFSQIVEITWGSAVKIVNPLEGKGVEVTTEGDQVIIRSTVDEMEYVLSGVTASGGVKIYSDSKFKLTFNGVEITNPHGPAVNVQSHKRVFVQLNEGTVNKLTDGSSYKTVSGEDMKGAFFSEGQLLFYGTGVLEVTGNYKHAICSDDYVRIYEGEIRAKANVSDGIHVNDAFVMDGGKLNVQAKTDGIECEEGYVLINDGNIIIQSGDDGITASYEGNDSAIDPYLEIYKGSIQVTTSGISAKAIKSRGDLIIHDGEIKVKTSQREAEGIESKKTLTIHGGLIEVEAYDDCINAANSIVINGGNIYCYSAANDGIDSNGTLTITGGCILSIGTSSPEEGFDCDRNTFKITGGILIGIGGATSTPTSTACTQRSLVYGGSATALTPFHILSATGEDILTYILPRTLNQMTLLFSSPSLKEGSYTIYSGGSISGGTSFHGLYAGSSYASGKQLATFNASSMVTTVGSSNGGNRPPTGW